MKNTLIIGGSPRTTISKSNLIVDYISSILPGSNVWKLGKKPLPTAKPEWHEDPSNSEDKTVVNFYDAIQKSEQIIIVSPTYHGSFTSHLKNALDCMGKNDFRGKTVFLCGMGYGVSAILPCIHLQDVVRTMKGNVYPRFIAVDNSDVNIDDGSLSKKSTDRINEIIGEIR